MSHHPLLIEAFGEALATMEHWRITMLFIDPSFPWLPPITDQDRANAEDQLRTELDGKAQVRWLTEQEVHRVLANKTRFEAACAITFKDR